MDRPANDRACLALPTCVRSFVGLAVLAGGTSDRLGALQYPNGLVMRFAAFRVVVICAFFAITHSNFLAPRVNRFNLAAFLAFPHFGGIRCLVCAIAAGGSAVQTVTSRALKHDVAIRADTRLSLATLARVTHLLIESLRARRKVTNDMPAGLAENRYPSRSPQTLCLNSALCGAIICLVVYNICS